MRIKKLGSSTCIIPILDTIPIAFPANNEILSYLIFKCNIFN